MIDGGSLNGNNMAGHSHWAGIKHKKGRADKESKIFSKLSREITVAAKLGDKDDINQVKNCHSSSKTS